MEELFNLPQEIVISPVSTFSSLSKVTDLKQKPLKDLEDPILYISNIFIEESVISPEYDLYLVKDSKNINEKIEQIKSVSQDAIILHIVGEKTEAYYVENGQLVSKNNFENLSKTFDVNTLPTNNSGKVDVTLIENQKSFKSFLRKLRLEGGRGIEAEVSGTRRGDTVFSTSFGPCIPVLAKIKNGPFILYHAQNTGFEDTLKGAKKFFESIKSDEELESIFIFQKAESSTHPKKTAILTLNLLVAVKEKYPKLDAQNCIKRINCSQGFDSVVAVSENAGKNYKILLTENPQIIKKGEEYLLESNSPKKNMKTQSAVVEKNSIPLSKTVEEVQDLNNQKDYKGRYKTLLSDVKKILPVSEKQTTPQDPPQTKSFIKNIFNKK